MFTDKHTFYLWTGNLDSESCAAEFQLFLERLHQEYGFDYRSTGFQFKVIERPGGLNYGYLHVNSTEVFYLMTNHMPNGTKREVVIYPNLADFEVPLKFPPDFDQRSHDEQWQFLVDSYCTCQDVDFYEEEIWKRFDEATQVQTLPRIVTNLPFDYEPAKVKISGDRLICSDPMSANPEEVAAFLQSWSTVDGYPQGQTGQNNELILQFSRKTHDAAFAYLFHKRCQIPNGPELSFKLRSLASTVATTPAPPTYSKKRAQEAAHQRQHHHC